MTRQQLDEVRQLSAWLAATDITVLELTGPGKTIRLRRNGATVVAPPLYPMPVGTEPAVAAPTVVRAGSVGILLQSHPLRTEPLVRPGQQVAAGQAVALLKIGLLLLAVPAPRAGRVSRIVAANETPVGFGDPLVELA